MKNIVIIVLVLTIGFFSACNRSGTEQQSKSNESGLPLDEQVIPEPVTDYLALGKTIATSTQAVLAKNLVDAMNKNGTEYALQFCNTKAISLTDSMSQVLIASIKRVTDKPRNPGNQANQDELSYMEEQKNRMMNGDSAIASLRELDEKMIGYYPIVTKAMCLQCHGRKDVNISPATYSTIRKLYPSDKAIGYSENELRGLWVIEMVKK